MAAKLRFANLSLDKSQCFWNNIPWTEETNVEVFGHNAPCHVWRKSNIAHQHKIPHIN